MSTNIEQRSEVKVQITNEIYKYALNHSSQLHSIQQEIIEFTKTHERYMMCTQGDQVIFFKLLLQVLNAKKVIDVGVFTGLSSLSAALAMDPKVGKVVACDVSTDYTKHAVEFWKKAGVDHMIDLVIQPASITLQQLLDKGEEGTYDFVFIDADKEGYDTYYELSLRLIRKGGIIALDNVLQSGNVVDEKSTNPNVIAMRALNDKIAKDDRVTKSMLCVADGITLITKN